MKLTLRLLSITSRARSTFLVIFYFFSPFKVCILKAEKRTKLGMKGSAAGKEMDQKGGLPIDI